MFFFNLPQTDIFVKYNKVVALMYNFIKVTLTVCTYLTKVW